VLNRALEGWKRLRKRGGFRKSEDMSNARDVLLIHANPLKGFIGECCEPGQKNKMTLDHFYDAYRSWAAQSGYSMTQNKSTVKANLGHQGYAVTSSGTRTHDHWIEAPGAIVTTIETARRARSSDPYDGRAAEHRRWFV
jgi:phage/plasmid-associated DNA primase